jgi:RNA polymerase sigma-70 factor (ECF subfamily)
VNKEEEYLNIEHFTDLYERFGPMVLRRCRFLLKDEEKALDCMQDVFVRILERKERITSVCSSLFYTVATRVCLNKIRYDSVRWAPDIESFITEIEDNYRANHEDIIDASLVLDAIFDETKKSTQDMALMHYVDGFTLEETAKEVGLSVSGVRKRLLILRKKALAKHQEE